MSRRKPLAALAAATAALAVALPATSASAATTAPAVPAVSFGVGTGLMAGSLACQMLITQMDFATQTGNILWANVLSNVFVYSGCGGAAI